MKNRLYLCYYSTTYLIELNDIRVPDDLENVDLSSYTLDIGLVLDLVFLQDFDRHFLARDQVGSQPDLAESALTEGATYIDTKID